MDVNSYLYILANENFEKRFHEIFIPMVKEVMAPIQKLLKLEIMKHLSRSKRLNLN